MKESAGYFLQKGLFDIYFQSDIDARAGKWLNHVLGYTVAASSKCYEQDTSTGLPAKRWYTR